jgi:hypothetical protein
MAESKRKSHTKSKKKRGPKQFNSQMVAIALMFVLLIVSYVVIFSGPNTPENSKNMVFSEDNENPDIRIGNVEDLSYELSDVYLSIKDAGTGTKDTIDVLEQGSVAETLSGFNCTFFDENDDDKLTSKDKFVVYNAEKGDEIKIYLIDSNEVVAFYIF